MKQRSPAFVIKRKNMGQYTFHAEPAQELFFKHSTRSDSVVNLLHGLIVAMVQYQTFH
jgi:hypothetical protein